MKKWTLDEQDMNLIGYLIGKHGKEQLSRQNKRAVRRQNRNRRRNWLLKPFGAGNLFGQKD